MGRNNKKQRQRKQKAAQLSQNETHDKKAEKKEDKPQVSIEATKEEKKPLDKRDDIAALTKEIERLKITLAEKDGTISQLKQEKDTTISRLEKEKEQNEDEIAKLKTTTTDAADRNDIESLKKQLNAKSEECSKAQASYHNLLSRLASMKDVFRKMKASEVELEETKKALAKIQDEKSKILEQNKLTVRELQEELNRTNLKVEKLQHDSKMTQKTIEINSNEYAIESKRLKTANKKLVVELQESKTESDEYLIMVNEGKSRVQGLQHEIDEFKIKCDSLEKDIDQTKLERDILLKQNEELNETLEREKNSSAKKEHELTDSIEGKTVEIEKLQKQAQECERLKSTQKENEKVVAQLQDELKNKVKTVGKLRKDVIVLNEHLTKAMKLIKQESSEETVDRELVSNLFISFLQIPRGDSKKYEVLQLISNYLNWDNEKRRHAGLISSSSSINSNSVIDSPTGRTNSSKSFVSLWTEFLEKESTPQAH